MVSATVPVTGFEKAKDFYGGTLGLEFLWEGPISVWFRCGDSSEILIFKRPPRSLITRLPTSRWPISRPWSATSRQRALRSSTTRKGRS